jgi:hypothetical protein
MIHMGLLLTPVLLSVLLCVLNQCAWVLVDYSSCMRVVSVVEQFMSNSLNVVGYPYMLWNSTFRYGDGEGKERQSLERRAENARARGRSSPQPVAARVFSVPNSRNAGRLVPRNHTQPKRNLNPYYYTTPACLGFYTHSTLASQSISAVHRRPPK